MKLANELRYSEIYLSSPVNSPFWTSSLNISKLMISLTLAFLNIYSLLAVRGCSMPLLSSLHSLRNFTHTYGHVL